MNVFVVLFLFAILLIPVININALPGTAELVLENIAIEPSYPKIGDPVVITADVYNSGTIETRSLASIITIGYLIDGDLVDIKELDNVKPGLSNKIKIFSEPVWNADSDEHIITIILDYHDTLNDQYDSIDNNISEKIISIHPRKSLNISLNAFPPYVVENKETLLTITLALDSVESVTRDNGKELTLTIGDYAVPLTLDSDNVVSMSTIVASANSLEILAHFNGDSQYLPSDSSLMIYSIPQNVHSGIIMSVVSTQKQFTFENYSYDFIIFQDSYDQLYGKFSAHENSLDSNSILIPLPAGHNYFVEVYMNGRLIHVTTPQLLSENHIFVKEVPIPDSAQVRFRVTDESGEPQSNVTVNNWIYSGITDENGLTDWIDVLPTAYNNPYNPEVVYSAQKSILSDSFFIFSKERKTIDIIVPDTHVPSWVRNNTGWWANGQIDDSSFIQSIQFLIKKGILNVESSPQNISSDNKIPSWIRNNAGWWANGQIDDSSFIQSIQFLIKEGIVRIQ